MTRSHSVAAPIVGLAILLVVVGATAHGAPARRTCYPPHSRTVAATADVRVFRVFTHKTDDPWGIANGETIFSACLLRVKRPMELGAGHIRPIAIAGHFVAFYSTVVIDYARCGGEADVADLASRTMRSAPDSFNGNGPPRVVLTPSGAMAYALPQPSDCVPLTRPPDHYELRTLGPSGPNVVDSSPDIDPYSLAIGGSWLYWTKSRQPQSARLN